MSADRFTTASIDVEIPGIDYDHASPPSHCVLKDIHEAVMFVNTPLSECPRTDASRWMPLHELLAEDEDE